MSPPEHARRSTLTAAVLALFRSRPMVWIPWRELAEVGGACGWRTRCSNSRQIVKREDGADIVWNKQIRRSAYRYVPAVPRELPVQVGLFEGELIHDPLLDLP